MPRLLGLTSLAFALAAAPALGAPITLDGITLDAGSTFNRTLYHNSVNQVGDLLNGYGEVLEINGSSGTTWTAGSAGYHLTYVLKGYVVSEISSSYVGFSGGEVLFYVQNESDAGYTALTPTPPGGANTAAEITQDLVEAGDGTLWLSTIGNTFNDAVSGKPVTLQSTGVNGSSFALANSTGLLDITGGRAAPYLPKDSIADNSGSPADLRFGTPTNTFAANSGSERTGSADLRGIGVAQIPEPSTSLLFGLGLFAWGASKHISRRERFNPA